MRVSEALMEKFSIDLDSSDVMIAFYPNKETISKVKEFKNKLKLKSGTELADDEFHITLRYWKCEDSKKLEKVKEFLKHKVYFSRADMAGKVIKLEKLGKDKDDQALVFKIDSKSIEKFQEKLDKELQEIGVPPSDFPNFICHMTLAYSFEDEIPEEVPDFEIGIGSIKFVCNNESLWTYEGD